jgi:protein-S-isoprenylcysteine O-methyltransferase Ste14
VSAIILLKNIVLSLLGLIVIYFFSIPLPFWITASEFEPFYIEIGSLGYVGWIPIILGALAILWCYWIFIVFGKGTPWPFDPPKKLLVIGPYRYVRNPMELSFILILFGEALLFESSALIIYILIYFIFFHLRQVLIEEPILRRRFGKPYDQYCQSVPRWIPRLSAYVRDG